MSRLLRASGFALAVLLFVTFGPMAMRGAWSLVPVKGAQVGCTGGCTFETSFLTTNKNYDGSATGAKTGWTADVYQAAASCANGTPGNLTTEQAGVSSSGGWVDGLGNCDGVITAANYASGAGGRGFRHYRAPGSTGANSNGGGIKFIMPSNINSGIVNITWMEKWDAGMNWNYSGHGPEPHYAKNIYMRTSNFLICGYEGGAAGCNYNGGSSTSSVCTWVGVMGGQNSDGNWHNFELQINITGQYIKTWIDGSLCVDQAYSFPLWQGLDEMFISNQAYVNVAGFTDFDDFKVETGLASGDRIGSPTEIGGGGSGGGTGSGVPATPTGLRLRLRVPGIGGFFGLQH